MKKKKKRAIPVTLHAGIAIREIRPGYFMVDTQRDGKRDRKCFSDLEAAKTYCSVLGRKIDNEGYGALSLTPAQRDDAWAAIQKLDGQTSLVDAVSFWCRHHGRVDGVTVQQLGRRWLKALKSQGCRDTTIGEREQKLNRLCRDMGEKPAQSISRDDLVEWMDQYHLAGATRDGYRRCYRAMFQYAVDERIMDYNPAAAIKAIRMDERLPTPFTVNEVKQIMHAAATYTPILIPTLAVQFFAGLRPGEALGLDWQAIDFKQKIIRVTPETSKVRRSRLVEISATLKQWLAPHARNAGPIGITTKSQFGYYMHRKEIQQGENTVNGLIKASGVRWIQDGPRKSFASAHYAKHEDAAKLAAILGHTGGHDILFRHYRGLMTKPDANRYFKLAPSQEGKIIPLSKTA